MYEHRRHVPDHKLLPESHAPGRGRDCIEEAFRSARDTSGFTIKDHEPLTDMVRMRRYRLKRVRDQLALRDVGSCLLFDPINIRYASGLRSMQIFAMHNPERSLFVPAQGETVLFDSYAARNTALVEWCEAVDEVRPAISWFWDPNPSTAQDAASRWAAEIATLHSRHGGYSRPLAVDRISPLGMQALSRLGIKVVEAHPILEQARSIKSAEEIACIMQAVAVCEMGMAKMREALQPGLTEAALWSLLVQANAEHLGEWCETRLLSSGGRTNPWFQECGDRMIRCGDLVAFDTDMVGPFGYCADISRTFHCGPARPTREQKRLYSYAYEQLQCNMQLLRPGLTFRQFAEASWRIPEEFLQNRYVCLAHGVGLADEFPDIPHLMDWDEQRSDGVFEPGMVLSVESYIGAANGVEGVKLEEQVLITERSAEPLSMFPFEEHLLPAGLQ